MHGMLRPMVMMMTIGVLLVPPAATAGDQRIYDRYGSYRGRLKDDERGNTRVYDEHGRYRGRITEGRFYDRDGRYLGRYETGQDDDRDDD